MPRFLKFILGTSNGAQDLHSPTAAIRFTLVATVLYAVFVSSPLNLDAVFAPGFRAFGNYLFAHGFLSHDEASVHFLDARAGDLFEQVDDVFEFDLPRSFDKSIPRAIGEKDTLLVLQNTLHLGKVGFLRTGARLMAFTPAAILLAIVLATPVSLRRRLALGIFSFALLSAFIAFRLAILIIHGGFAVATKAYHLYEPSDFWRDVLNRVDTIVCDNPTFHYVAPVVIWVIAAIGLSIVAHLLHSRGRSAVPPSLGR